ncbi:hypothetical protein YERSI8AC_220192 [Enterobacterales bacterium 8AC]|nr:hypothetical protein YERSI8AC_220192 [Enterobacterales bacterium 8AC]
MTYFTLSIHFTLSIQLIIYLMVFIYLIIFIVFINPQGLIKYSSGLQLIHIIIRSGE